MLGMGTYIGGLMYMSMLINIMLAKYYNQPMKIIAFIASGLRINGSSDAIWYL